jgi:ATP-dependent DNA helicase RecQ
MLPKNKAKEQILSFIKPFKGQTGIIYCSTRKKTEEWSKYLKEHSFNALPYHAGMTVENRKKKFRSFYPRRRNCNYSNNSIWFRNR